MNVVIKACLLILAISLLGCKNEETAEASKELKTAPIAAKTPNSIPLSHQFKAYWYQGVAEITSFELLQERYGEIRTGTAVQIFVTEDFLPDSQVKAETSNPANIPVLKLNATKKFQTGVYPYAIMESTFYPVKQGSHALKVSASIQEWCGQVYTQINNRDSLQVQRHSYFQGEADQQYKLAKSYMENELWNLLRINPEALPTGNLKLVPSLEYLQLRHVPVKAYSATASLKNGSYTVTYPDLERRLIVQFNPEFPYDILGWEESIAVGSGREKRIMSTKAKRMHKIQTAYWAKNSNEDAYLREELGLE